MSFKDRPIIGLTGGIACGKSAVSRLLAERDAVIVDADQIARGVLAPGSEGLRRVVQRWGEALVSESGDLNRAALGEIIFSDPRERHALESITHPLIAAESERQLEAALSSKPPLVVYDAALLIEAGRAEQFRPLVVVSTTQSLQIERLMSRDGYRRDEAEQRISAQLPLLEKESIADHLIMNHGSWEDLEARVDELWRSLFKA